MKALTAYVAIALLGVAAAGLVVPAYAIQDDDHGGQADPSAGATSSGGNLENTTPRDHFTGANAGRSMSTCRGLCHGGNQSGSSGGRASNNPDNHANGGYENGH